VHGLHTLRPSAVAQRQGRPTHSVVARARIACSWTPGTYTQSTPHSRLQWERRPVRSKRTPYNGERGDGSSRRRTYVLVCDQAVCAEPRIDEAAGRSTLEVPTASARASSGRAVADRLRGANRRSELPSAAGERVIDFERKRPSDVRECIGVVVVGTSVCATWHGAGPAVIQKCDGVRR
jgi:hypothetical protein